MDLMQKNFFLKGGDVAFKFETCIRFLAPVQAKLVNTIIFLSWFVFCG